MRSSRLTTALLLLLVAAVSAIGMTIKTYPPDAAALAAMRGGDGIAVTDSKQWIAFEPRRAKRPDVILYPGALVSPESYAPLARLLAEDGFRTWIVKMPFRLAVLGVQRAADIIEMDPQQSYVIGGHSLGGTMAARFAARFPDRLEGLFLLAAYPDWRGSVKDTKLAAISLAGTEDGVMNRQKYEHGKAYLPEDTDYEEIIGGNHAGFGSYGAQKGDKPSHLKPGRQTELTETMLVNWMNRFISR